MVNLLTLAQFILTANAAIFAFENSSTVANCLLRICEDDIHLAFARSRNRAYLVRLQNANLSRFKFFLQKADRLFFPDDDEEICVLTFSTVWRWCPPIRIS